MNDSPGADARPWLRLRQIALLAPALAPLEATLHDVLGLSVCHRDPAVAKFGLENVLFPIGHQFLEIVAPTTAESAGARQLARQGGAGGYMVITQCRDHLPYRERARALGVRVVHAYDEPDFRHTQFHPRDTGGSFLEIDEQVGPHAHAPDGPWAPAGPDWRAVAPARVSAITAVEMACAAPRDVAARWAALTGCRTQSHGASVHLKLDDAVLRFVPRTPDERALPDRLIGIDVVASAKLPIVEAAARCGLRTGPDQLTLAGIRISLV